MRDLGRTCTARIRDGVKHFTGDFAGSERGTRNKRRTHCARNNPLRSPIRVGKAVAVLYKKR